MPNRLLDRARALAATDEAAVEARLAEEERAARAEADKRTYRESVLRVLRAVRRTGVFWPGED